MQQYKCLIVEDEPLAAGILEDFVREVPFLLLTASCPDAFCAMDILRKEKIDLIFLDMHLPNLKGIDFIKTLTNPPRIIITSAYHDYALQGYEYNVIDYLLKPIEFSRFLMAVNKLKQTSSVETHVPGIYNSSERTHLFFSVSRKKVKLFLDEILYIEGVREYIKIVAQNKTILTKFQIGEVEELLTKNKFIRVHRSFIVARNKIEAFTATDVEIDGKQIPVGRSYKELVQSAFEATR